MFHRIRVFKKRDVCNCVQLIATNCNWLQPIAIETVCNWFKYKCLQTVKQIQFLFSWGIKSPLYFFLFIYLSVSYKPIHLYANTRSLYDDFMETGALEQTVWPNAMVAIKPLWRAFGNTLSYLIVGGQIKCTRGKIEGIFFIGGPSLIIIKWTWGFFSEMSFFPSFLQICNIYWRNQ